MLRLRASLEPLPEESSCSRPHVNGLPYWAASDYTPREGQYLLAATSLLLPAGMMDVGVARAAKEVSALPWSRACARTRRTAATQWSISSGSRTIALWSSGSSGKLC
jgi:hypothetical protein